MRTVIIHNFNILLFQTESRGRPSSHIYLSVVRDNIQILHSVIAIAKVCIKVGN